MLTISKYTDIFNTSINFSPIRANIFVVVVAEACKFQDYRHLKITKTFQRSKFIQIPETPARVFCLLFKFIHIVKF